MLPFLHDRVQRLSDVLQTGSAALRVCSADDVAVTDAVLQYLGTAEDSYRSLGLDIEENEVLALRAELEAARRGVILATQERVTSRRRSHERIVAGRVLLQSLGRLRD